MNPNQNNIVLQSSKFRKRYRVGYKVVKNEPLEKKMKQKVEIVHESKNRVERKKFGEPKALNGGNFINSEYVKGE